MQNTVNLNLKKPDQNDFVNIGDINDNMDVLDAEVAKKYIKPLAGIPSLDLDSATQAALKKAETALQTVTKSSVGLGNVDNTSDVNKPVSTAQQVALDKKANLASPSLTGTPTAPTAAESTNTQQIATTAFVDRAVKTHQEDLAHVHWIGTAIGTNTLTATYEAITALKNGLGVAFLNTTSSTGATTLNINGLGATPILKANGNPVTNLKTSGIYTLRYANGNFILQGEGGEYGTATASDVLAGKTFGTEDGIVAGSMLDNGVKTLSTSGADQNIEGFYAKGSKVKALELVPGDYLIFSKPSETSMYATDAYKPISEIIKVNGIGGTIRIKYDIKTAGDYLGNSKVYVNGKAVGVTRNFTSSTYTTFTEDIKVNAGDALQIYAFSPSSIIYLRNFNIYNSFVLGSFS